MSGRFASLKKSAVVSQSVQTVIEALEARQLLSATITLVNPDALPSSDRLIFNTIQNLDPTVPNAVHNTNPLTIENTGDATLTLSSLTISGPWEFVNAPVGNYAGTQLAPGGSLTVTLEFTQNSLPPHSGNQTNDTTETNGGAVIDGALTINSNDPTTPTKTVTLAGYWQSQSADEEEPNLLTITNALAGYNTVIATPAQLATVNGVDLQNNAATPTFYGQEVVSNSWVAANVNQPVTIQELAEYEVEGVTNNTFWYSAVTMDSHLLMTSAANEAQTLLPLSTTGQAMTSSFNPGGPFGFRDDNHYSDDSVNIANGDSTDDGHRFRFYPLIDENGAAVPNTWLVAVHNGDLIPDYQDAVYIVSNMQPAPSASTPPAPTGLTATSAADPVLSWTGVTYNNLEGYNIYRSTSSMGVYTKLTSTPTLLTTFTDTASPPAGTTLFYRVTAVDNTSQNESAPATTTANTPGGPVAGSFSVNAFTAQAVSISVLNHVTDSTGSPTPGSLVIATAPTHGTATVDTTNGLISYTSNAGFTGSDTIVYSIGDNNSGGPSSGTITVAVVNGAITPPIVSNQSSTTLANTPVTLTPTAVDITATPITPALVEIANTSADFSTVPLPTTLTTAAGGTITLNSNNTVTYTPAANFVGADSFLFKVEDSHGNLSNQATFSINVGVEISTAKGANKSVVYPDTNGQQVTVALSKGVADVFFNGSGTEGAAKGKITITGSHLTISNIAASQTTASSALSLKTTHNAGLITLGGVTDAGTLGSITGLSTNLVGVNGKPTIVVGGLRSINLKQINTAEIQVGNAGVTSISFTAGAVTDSFFTSTVTVSTLKAASWTNVIADLGTEAITAPVIKSLIIAGEFDPNLSLTGTGKDLNSAKVGTSVNKGVWNIAGSTGAINIGSVGSQWGGVTVGGKVSGLTIKSGGLAVDVNAGSVGSLVVTGNLSGDLTTGSIGTLKATGAISGSEIVTTGSIQSITAASIADSLISAGAGADASFADSTLANIGTDVIHSIHFTTHSGNAFSDTTIAADEIISASLGMVNTSNSGNPVGLIAVTLKSVTANIGGVAAHLGAPQLVSDATVQAYEQSKSITPGDFTIDVL
jgi:Bacterial Ig domain